MGIVGWWRLKGASRSVGPPLILPSDDIEPHMVIRLVTDRTRTLVLSVGHFHNKNSFRQGYQIAWGSGWEGSMSFMSFLGKIEKP